ncbi:hypothetical protein [Priestia aryabhattai]
MRNILYLVESILNKIEKENEILTAREWKRELEERLTDSLEKGITENAILDFIQTIKFTVDCNYEGVFREIRTEFNDMYASVDISFSLSEGIEYVAQTDVEVILDYLDEEKVVVATKTLKPERLRSLALQWPFWRQENKKEFVENELVDAANLKVGELVQQITCCSDVKEEEERIKSAILLAVRDELSLSVIE